MAAAICSVNDVSRVNAHFEPIVIYVPLKLDVLLYLNAGLVFNSCSHTLFEHGKTLVTSTLANDQPVLATGHEPMKMSTTDQYQRG